MLVYAPVCTNARRHQHGTSEECQRAYEDIHGLERVAFVWRESWHTLNEYVVVSANKDFSGGIPIPMTVTGQVVLVVVVVHVPI